MNIKKLLGMQSQKEKIKEYRQLQQELSVLNNEATLLAESYSLQKSQLDDLSNHSDPEVRIDALRRFQAFSSQQTADVIKLCNRKTSIEKSMKNIEKDAEIAELIADIKDTYSARGEWKKGNIRKSVYFDILKAKSGGPVRFADVLVFRGDKLLILQRAGEGGSFSEEWCIPGGHVDPGEDFREAAARELYEETGIEIPESLLEEVAVYKNKDVDIHYFMTHVDNESPVSVVVDSQEEIGSAWINPYTELDQYKFIFDMKENLENILGCQRPNPVLMVLKAFTQGKISPKVFEDFAKSHKEDIRKAENKTYFSHKERKDLAKKGEAMPNGKYPIRNAQDLHDAIKLVGASSMPEGEVKAWIKKRAKALKLTDELPDDWKEKDIEKAYFSEEERKELAEKGEAMPDGKYPIRNSSDLRNAIRLVGNSDVPESKVKAWIKKRAKALGLEDELPEEWEHVEKATDTEDAETMANESLDGEAKKDVNTKDSEEKEDSEKSPFDKAELEMIGEAIAKSNGFNILVSFNDLDQAEMFKSLIEEWSTSGKLDVGFVKSIGNDLQGDTEGSSVEKAKPEKKVFNEYLNFIEGAKTRLKNIHWGEEDNSKHVYLDSLTDEVSDFEDKIAEAGQAGFGRFSDGEIQGDEVTEDDPVAICQMIFDKTIDFRHALEGKDDYNGEISWIDDFLASLKQTKYRLQMH
jgi:8-oxo-dGTP diphosphatase